MLEDFIVANQLSAKILNRIVKNHRIVCSLFLADKKPVLAVLLAGNRVDEKRVKGIVKAGTLEKPNQIQTEDITGYAQEFLPPISVYGVTVLIDSAVMEKETVNCVVGEEKTLSIAPKEIKEFNEEAVVEKIAE
jgi:prolyl-tRNA editing enzyme YbaK/EbsC (Cys-tRNA(Pro) deacylase)